jgi:ankyrin repeat protein
MDGDVGSNGMTALMLAAWKGHTDIVNALAGPHNANVEARSDQMTLMVTNLCS